MSDSPAGDRSRLVPYRLAGLILLLIVGAGLGIWQQRTSREAKNQAKEVPLVSNPLPRISPPLRIHSVELVPAFVARSEMDDTQLYRVVLTTREGGVHRRAIDKLLVLREPVIVADTLVVGVRADSASRNTHLFLASVRPEAIRYTEVRLPADFHEWFSGWAYSADGSHIAYVGYGDGSVSGIVRSLPSLEQVGRTNSHLGVSTDSPEDLLEWTGRQEVTFVLRVTLPDGRLGTEKYVVNIAEPTKSRRVVDDSVLYEIKMGNGPVISENEYVSQPPASPSTGNGSGQPLFDFQVDRPATEQPGSPRPRYPEMLRAGNIEGKVVAQFVVDADGRVETQTFQVITSAHYLFEEAVRSALPSMRFTPAEVRGRRVRQLVQQPFIFAVQR